jgi:hypothetical protein
MCWAGSTFTPKTALTWACVRREQGSLGGAPYAAGVPQNVSVKEISAISKITECFERIEMASLIVFRKALPD